MMAARSITTRSPEYMIYERKNPYYDWKDNPRGPKKPLTSRLQSWAWEDQKCFIIGGGPSLVDFNFEQLKDHGRIIAINKAFLSVPFADMLFAMDTDLYSWLVENKLGKAAHSAFIEFKGLKVWIDNQNYPFKHKDILFVKRNRIPELTKNLERGIFTGNNSGIGALVLAAALGCNPIYLLGYDMGHAGKQSHFHSGYPRVQRESVAKSFIKHFNRIAPQLKKNGFKVINLNRKSNLKCFPFGDLKDAIK